MSVVKTEMEQTHYFTIHRINVPHMLGNHQSNGQGE